MASSATRHFILQRFTGLIQVPLLIWFILSMLRHGGASRADFMAWIGEPLTAGLMMLFILSSFYHMRLGMAEIIEDYIHRPTTRNVLVALNTVVALGLGAVAAFSIIAITLIV